MLSEKVGELIFVIVRRASEVWDLLKSIYEETSANVMSQGNSTPHASSVDSLDEDSSINKSENERSTSGSSMVVENLQAHKKR